MPLPHWKHLSESERERLTYLLQRATGVTVSLPSTREASHGGSYSYLSSLAVSLTRHLHAAQQRFKQYDLMTKANPEVEFVPFTFHPGDELLPPVSEEDFLTVRQDC